MGLIVCMMRPLVTDVIPDPRQISRAETHHAKPALPFQNFAIGDSVVYEMGAGALKFADPFAGLKCRRNRYDEMHVVINPADLMKEYARSFGNFATDKTVQLSFDFIAENWLIVLNTPYKMQIDLAVCS